MTVCPAGNTTWEGEIVDLVWEANKSLHGTHIFGTIYGSNPVSGELFFDQAIIKIVNANHLEVLDGEFGEALSFHRLVDSAKPTLAPRIGGFRPENRTKNPYLSFQ